MELPLPQHMPRPAGGPPSPCQLPVPCVMHRLLSCNHVCCCSFESWSHALKQGERAVCRLHWWENMRRRAKDARGGHCVIASHNNLFAIACKQQRGPT